MTAYHPELLEYLDTGVKNGMSIAEIADLCEMTANELQDILDNDPEVRQQYKAALAEYKLMLAAARTKIIKENKAGANKLLEQMAARDAALAEDKTFEIVFVNAKDGRRDED